MKKYLFLSLLYLTSFCLSEAQPLAQDTAQVFVPHPDKALLISLILPGIGQAYNRETWKIPIIWALFIGLGYYAEEKHRQYVYSSRSLLYVVDKSPSTQNRFPRLSQTDLEYREENFRRDRDYAFILIGLSYFLQAIEAHVSAHLLNFDSDPSLSYLPKPIQTQTPQGRAFGLSFFFSVPLSGRS